VDVDHDLAWEWIETIWMNENPFGQNGSGKAQWGRNAEIKNGEHGTMRLRPVLQSDTAKPREFSHGLSGIVPGRLSLAARNADCHPKANERDDMHLEPLLFTLNDLPSTI
jgi:hypothetical protein